MFGIKNNTWHLILSVAGLLGFALLITLTLNQALMGRISRQFLFIISLFSAGILTTWLQFAYECRQLYNHKSVTDHGGYERFATDSKKDTRLALIGVFLGSLLYAIIFIMLTYGGVING